VRDAHENTIVNAVGGKQSTFVDIIGNFPLVPIEIKLSNYEIYFTLFI
jgi:hypothetical protein